jgi:hypothetical protein
MNKVILSQSVIKMEEMTANSIGRSLKYNWIVFYWEECRETKQKEKSKKTNYCSLVRNQGI